MFSGIFRQFRPALGGAAPKRWTKYTTVESPLKEGEIRQQVDKTFYTGLFKVRQSQLRISKQFDPIAVS